MSAPGLPWGEQELRHQKDGMHRAAERIRAGQARLGMGYGDLRSSPHYRASNKSVDSLHERIEAWEPPEGVLSDHRAEAVAIVYEGMRKAGLVARQAWRAPRVGFRG